jgi:hypothetical protein
MQAHMLRVFVVVLALGGPPRQLRVPTHRTARLA